MLRYAAIISLFASVSPPPFSHLLDIDAIFRLSRHIDAGFRHIFRHYAFIITPLSILAATFHAISLMLATLAITPLRYC
jgi:hypothetical protein